jgi:hypothetical protein
LGIYDGKIHKEKERREKAKDKTLCCSALAKAAGRGESRPKVVSDAQAKALKRNHAYMDQSQNPGSPFRIESSELLTASGKIRAGRDKSYVTTFSDWVFSTYSVTNLSADELEFRAKEEVTIDKDRLLDWKRSQEEQLDKHRGSYIEEVANDGWSVIYKHFGSHEADALRISALKLNNGSCMYGKPDIVLHHKKTRKFLLVEVKSTRMIYVPSDGWPNLRAQLWAYSKADIFEEASDVILGAEVYFHQKIGSALPEKRRFNNDQAFQDENSRLFARYVEVAAQNA